MFSLFMRALRALVRVVYFGDVCIADRMPQHISERVARWCTPPVPTTEEVAQNLVHLMARVHAQVAEIQAQIDYALETAAIARDIERTRLAPSEYVPLFSDDDFSTWLGGDTPLFRVPTTEEFEAFVAADVTPVQSAKRVRVHALAAELGVMSGDVRGWLRDEFGVNTASASATVSSEDADRLRKWHATHA